MDNLSAGTESSEVPDYIGNVVEIDVESEFINHCRFLFGRVQTPVDDGCRPGLKFRLKLNESEARCILLAPCFSDLFSIWSSTGYDVTLIPFHEDKSRIQEWFTVPIVPFRHPWMIGMVD